MAGRTGRPILLTLVCLSLCLIAEYFRHDWLMRKIEKTEGKTVFTETGSDRDKHDHSGETKLIARSTMITTTTTMTTMTTKGGKERNENLSKMRRSITISQLSHRLPIRIKMKILKAKQMLRLGNFMYDILNKFTPNEISQFGNQILFPLFENKNEISIHDTSNKRTASQMTYAYDCDNANVIQSNDIENCFRNSKCTIPNNDILYNGIIANSWMIDINAYSRQLGIKWIRHKQLTYIMHCPKISVLVMEDSRCLADGVLMVRADNISKYMTQNLFLTETFAEVECYPNETANQTIIRLANYFISVHSTIALMANSILYKFHLPDFMGKIMDVAVAGEIIDWEIAFLYGIEKGTILSALVIIAQKTFPLILTGYHGMTAIVSIVLFIMGLAKKLSLLMACSFCLPLLKKIVDYKKYTHETRKTNEIQLLELQKTMVIGPERFNSKSEHLATLYKNSFRINARLDAMDETIKRLRQTDTQNVESDSLTSVSTSM